MKLNLKKPIVFFDLETTGIDVATDRIVEICLIRLEPNGNRQSLTMRLNPERHIPEDASAVHGIYDTDVKDCPTFREKAEELKKEIQNYVKQHTAPYKYPRIVVFRDELPKTISGKIIRNKL